MPYLERTVFKGEIVTEFAVPEGGTDKIVIVGTGAPGYPKSKDFALSLLKRGFAVFIPRYRGSWESGGNFLEQPLQQDFIDILDELPKGFTDVLGQREHKLNPKKVYVIGGSFGGPAAIFSASDPRVTKVIAVCPVVDWTAESIDEPFEVLKPLMQKGFGEGYRMSEDVWKKLEAGELYNPVSHATDIAKYAHKIWIVHSSDDRSVLPQSIIEFAKNIGCKITTLRKGGHFGTSRLHRWPLSWKVKKYLS